MSSTYDPHELKIIRRGVSIDKVIAAYKHFGSYRKAAEVCGIAKGTVKAVVERYHVVALPASLPRKASYHPKRHYSDFAKWHKAHMNDKNLPHSLAEFASLANSNVNIVKCYFYRCRKETRRVLTSLPDLRTLDVALEDIEGKLVSSATLESYHYAIDRFSQRVALQGKCKDGAEVTVLIPSVEQFASRVRKLTASVD
jgi:hypothetical protein